MAKINQIQLYFLLLALVYLFGIVKCGYYNSNVALVKLFVRDAELTNELSAVFNRQPSLQALFSPYPFLKYIVVYGLVFSKIIVNFIQKIFWIPHS